MGTFSMWHWMIVLAVILIVFGAGKLPHVMGDLAGHQAVQGRDARDEDEKPAITKTQDESKAA